MPALLDIANERRQLVITRVSRKATVPIRGDGFEHIHRLDTAGRRRPFSGDLLVRLIGDVNMIRDLLLPSWLTIRSHGSVLVGGAVVFALVDVRLVNVRLVNVALMPLPLLFVSVRRTSSKVQSAASKQRRKEWAIAAQAAESIRQVGLIKAFSAEGVPSTTSAVTPAAPSVP